MRIHYGSGIGGLAGAGIAGIVEYFMTGGNSGLVPLGSGIIGAIIGWLVVLGVSSYTGTLGNQEQRRFVDKTPSEIVETLQLPRSVTSIQSDHMSGLFIGSWLKAEGRVEDVSEGFNFLWVHKVSVEIEMGDGTNINLDFEKRRWGPQLKVLSRGDQIAFVGQIESVSQYSLYLEDCELIAPSIGG